MEHTNVQEKRQFRRINHSEPVQFQFLDPRIAGGCVAKDLSEGGIRIRLNRFVPLKEDLTLVIHLADQNIVECTGRVVWVEKSRFGEYYEAGLMFSEDDARLINQEKICGFISHQ